jgi:hypothetical protein
MQPQGWIDNYKDGTTTYADGNWHFDFNCLSFHVDRMTGNDIEPETAPGNLEGDVTFTSGWCGAPTTATASPTGPTAVAAAKKRRSTRATGSRPTGPAPTTSSVGNPKYSWDTDGTPVGRQQAHGRPHLQDTGRHTATLKVTDAGGLSSTDKVTVTNCGSDLRVSNASTQNGGQITLTATVTNFVPGKAAATKTRFLRRLDADRHRGHARPSSPVRERRDLNLNGQTGQHVITVTADATGVGETTVNNRHQTVTIQ